jgi:L-seryl-tRNA(Ser) seleniumtransferase
MTVSAQPETSSDRFGNPHAPDLPYARGTFVRDTGDDLAKLRHAWKLLKARIEQKGLDAVYNFSGLDRRLSLGSNQVSFLDDEIAPAVYIDELTQLGLEHLGGDPKRHDVFTLNRLTAGLLLAAEILVSHGDRVIGVSPRYSHPAVRRAVNRAGGRFEDVSGLEAFRTEIGKGTAPKVVFVTRLSVSYEILAETELREIFSLAKNVGARIIVDDAGGARVGPAIFGQPGGLELGADVVATGLDKYGALGPRIGLLGGERDVVARIRARAFEIGAELRPMLYPAVVRSLKAYDPGRVRSLVATTKSLADVMRRRLGGNRLMETPVILQIPGEDLLELVMERGDLTAPPVVPFEATAGLAMLLLKHYGVLTVHFAGLPPGTSALLIKFVPPEVLKRFGGAEAFANAMDDCVTRLAELVPDAAAFRELLYGDVV